MDGLVLVDVPRERVGAVEAAVGRERGRRRLEVPRHPRQVELAELPLSEREEVVGTHLPERAAVGAAWRGAPLRESVRDGLERRVVLRRREREGRQPVPRVREVRDRPRAARGDVVLDDHRELEGISGPIEHAEHEAALTRRALGQIPRVDPIDDRLQRER